MGYKIKKKKKTILWPIKILKYSLPLFSFGFHGQIFLMFTTIFYCRKKESSTSPYFKCRPEHWFSKIKVVGGIAMFLHFLIAFITNTLYYKPIFLNCKSDLLKKSNSLPDIILLFTKMIIITIFILDKGVENEHWAILSFLTFVTGINSYFTLYYKNRKNSTLLSLNNFFSTTLFIGFLILLISKILKFLNFDGSIFLFFSCSLIIVIYIIFYKGDEMIFISKDFRNILNPDEYLHYVTSFYNYILNKNNSRNYSINLKSLITSIEENCIFQFCPLKKYLINLEKGLDFENLLFEFCEILFQYGITKFNGNIFLKNHYSIFLLVEMKNIKKALIILDSIKEENFSLQTNYNIFRCRKIIENYTSPFINKNNFFFEYRKNSIEFKINLEKVTTLYNEFVSLLLENKGTNKSNFEEINKIVYKIIKLNKKIDNNFGKLIKIKTNNYDIIKLYSEYVENILKNKEKIKKCQELKKLLYTNNINENQEKDYSNFNLEILKDNYNSYFLIISSKIKKLGFILDCSINLCNIFGYSKKELIGNHINILIPDIFHKKHNLLVNQKTEESKLNFLEGLYRNKVYSPNFIEKSVYCQAKSKCLIPLDMKVYLVNTEENELVYIAEITPRLTPKYDLTKKVNNDMPKCCVLTDKNFLIQSFTPDCLNILNLQYESINSNYNLFNYIKNFRNDYADAIKNIFFDKYSFIRNSGLISTKDNLKLQNKKINKCNIPKSEKQRIINDIFNKKYYKKCRIQWKIPENDILASTKISKNILRNSSIIRDSSYISNYNIEKELYMEVNNILFNNDLIGYFFKFSKIFNYENKSPLKCKVLDIETSNNEIKFTKVKKYECIFKPISNESNFSKIITNLRKKQKKKSLELMVSKGQDIYKEEGNETSTSNNSPKKTSKYCSTPDIPDINDIKELIITDDFIPEVSNCFRFNITNLTYELSNDNEQPDALNDNLKKEASEKINIYNKLRQKFKKKQNSFESFISSNSESESEGKMSSSKSSFISNTNSNSDSDSNRQQNKESETKEEISKKPEVEAMKEKNNINDDYNSKNTLNKNKYDNDLLNNCYKVNLDHIYVMKYDFYKETIVEEKNKISKIEEIRNCIKKKIPICVGKDEKYPFISIKINKKQRNSHNPGEKSEQLFTSSKLKNIDNLSEDILMEKKITDAIANHKDESFIKRLKNLSLISYVFLMICGFINIIYCFNVYYSINEIFKLTQIASNIKYYEALSVYYVRELTLLNFNIPEIKGGEYTNFPAKDKKNYIKFIQTKLKNLFIECQSSIKRIFSSTINLSDNSEKILSETILDVKINKNNNNNIINSDIFSTLIQFNNAFYSLALSNLPVEQNHTDVFNYIYNNFNNYRNGITALIGLFGNDYDYKKKVSKIIIIIILIVLLIAFLIIYLIGVKYFLSANKKRANYINIFYNINSKALKNSISESLNLLKKIKESQDKNFYEEKESESSLENSKSLSINKNNNKIGFDNKKTIFVNDKERNHKSVSNINITFIIIYGILIIFFYCYFFINWSQFFSIIKTIDNNIVFAFFFQQYQIQMIDMFNVYREYLFDNETKILNYTQLEYMRKTEDEIYDTITESNIKTGAFIINLINNNNDLGQKLSIPFCSNFETDYFKSEEECSNEFGIFIDYDFSLFSNYFLEEIKIQKNFAKYKFENEIIKGNLADYNISNIIKELEGNENNVTFRLDLFNDKVLHSKLNLLFINSLLPHLNNNREIIFKYIYVDKGTFFNALFIIYIILMTIIYLGLFWLIINILNSQIYRAKTALSIVPINFLSSQSNIKLVLNIA